MVSVRPKPACVYSQAWPPRKTAPRMMVSTSSQKNRPLRRARYATCAKCAVTPLVNRMTVLMSGSVSSTPEPPPNTELWMRRWITAAMSEAKNTDSEPMKASVPTPMNENRCSASGGAGVGSISVQRPLIHTASVTRMSATPTMNTSGTPSRPTPRMRMPNATQNGVMVRCSRSGGTSAHSIFSMRPPSSS